METSVGEAIVGLLEAYGVDTVFGIPGVHNIEMYRALSRSAIRHVLTRHEQGAGFMADGYGRATGRPGVCFTITGPGLTNIMTPMGQAWSDSVPMLVISTALDAADKAFGRGRLHEMRDQRGAAHCAADGVYEMLLVANPEPVTGDDQGRLTQLHAVTVERRVQDGRMTFEPVPGTEVAMDWRSSQWIAMRGRFDYRWSRQFLQGYLNAQQYFREGGRRDLTLRSDNSWQPGERTQVRVGGQYASSNEFVQQNTYDPNELNRVLQSDGFVTHRFENGGNVSLGASRRQEILARLSRGEINVQEATQLLSQLKGDRS